ncbi:conserved protein [Tepidicaulis marinus]|uniref:Conserved protein n=1 Tax=Tepidicaulis marinus TaxID=1333998 RepID=A0A081BDC2_9HYPH|nr:hypothetical protein [Tepidicaulis marinus]GAK46040.1 conserved protein [Tepidicaulis marinus]
MSKRDWLFFTAVGGFLALALVYAGSLNEHGSASGSYQSAAEIHTEADRIETQFPAAQSLKADPEATQDERERRDLAAQEGMALWAERLFWITFAGVVLLALTFLEAWKTAVAAQEMATITRTSAEKQLRAYISIEDVLLHNFDGPYATLIEVQYRNRGQTPAYNVRRSLKYHVSPSGEVPKDPEDDFLVNAERQGRLGIAPSQGRSVSIPIENRLFDMLKGQISAGRTPMFVVGRFYYRDVFGVERITAFNIRVPGDIDGPLDGAVFMYCDDGNWST